MKTGLILSAALLGGSLAVVGGTQRAVAAPITAAQELSQFNAIVFGNFASNSDVEGRLAVADGRPTSSC